MRSDSTICAISTAQGVGGIAVIRVSGENCFSITDKITSIDIDRMEANQTRFSRLQHESELIDEVMISKFVKPHSFTGENTIEIACHGSAYIQSAVLSALVDAGCRLAAPGEFTMRAYLNGKMDLTQAEAVADLIASESKASHELAMHQMKGGFSNDLKALREKLIDFAALIELELDFSEEDVEFADRDDLKSHVDAVIHYIKVLLESFSVGNAIKNGIPVAIVGRPNAGKSTLLNSLLNDDRAIVSDIAGTTRDTIEEKFNLGGHSFRLIDTAGIRESEDTIEKIGIERTFKSIQEASIVLYLFDATDIEIDELNSDLQRISGDKHCIILSNKEDKNGPKTEHPQAIKLSAKNNTGIDQLINALKAAAFDIVSSESNTIVSNMRHVEALKHALSDLERVKEGLKTNITGDFIAMDIRSSLHHLGSITGEITPDDLLGNIFGRFCIGK